MVMKFRVPRDCRSACKFKFHQNLGNFGLPSSKKDPLESSHLKLIPRRLIRNDSETYRRGMRENLKKSSKLNDCTEGR